jgi:hypothetical protein
MAPEAFKADIQGIRMDMGNLETVAEELSIWKKSVQAETINYSGAGWVVIGTSVMAIIFVGAGLLLIRAFMKRGSMLSLLTRAVKNAGEASPFGDEVVKEIKRHLKMCVHAPDTVPEIDRLEKNRKDLGNFAKKMGTFAEQKT